MAARLQNKISVDVAAESSSLDSFSFAGLLCVQDQQSKCLPANKPNQIHNQGAEFEFDQTPPESIVTNPIKQCPADLLISNGQIIPKAITLQSTQHLETDQPCIKDSVQTRRKRSTNTTSGTEVSAQQNPEFRIQDKKENPVPRKSIGQKIFKSFFSPCKECQVAKPVGRAHRMPEENGKSH